MLYKIAFMQQFGLTNWHRDISISKSVVKYKICKKFLKSLISCCENNLAKQICCLKTYQKAIKWLAVIFFITKDRQHDFCWGTEEVISKKTVKHVDFT